MYPININSKKKKEERIKWKETPISSNTNRKWKSWAIYIACFFIRSSFLQPSFRSYLWMSMKRMKAKWKKKIQKRKREKKKWLYSVPKAQTSISQIHKSVLLYNRSPYGNKFFSSPSFFLCLLFNFFFFSINPNVLRW